MNNSEKAKENAENLLIKIIEYLNEAEPDDEQREHRLKELACSLVTSTIDFEQDIDEILKDINDACLDIRNMAMVGAFRYKSGDETNVKKYGDKQSKNYFISNTQRLLQGVYF